MTALVVTPAQAGAQQGRNWPASFAGALVVWALLLLAFAAPVSAQTFPKLTGRVVAVDPAQLEPEQGGTNRFALSMDEAQLQAAEQFQYEEGSEYFTMMEAESGSTQQ